MSRKKTPYIGKFWSGCASQVKRGLEILGIGIIDIDSRDCMMLRAEQTPDKAYLEKLGEDYNLVDWYLDVLRKRKDKLLRITRYVVADAWFSKAKFVDEACLLGIPKAKLNLESCTVVFNDVFGRHVKVGGEIDFMSSRFGIMNHDFDVAFHCL